MKQPMCDDKALLIAYLYGDCDEGERRRAEEHLATCADCAAELHQLRDVRGVLREWVPPEQALGFRIVREEVRATVTPMPSRDAGGDRHAKPSRWSSALPAWAQLAAAVLLLAVGAAIANLDVRVGSGGVSIRTGWQKAAPLGQAQAPAHPVDLASRAELAAFKSEIEQELARVRTVAANANTAGAPRATTEVRLSPTDRDAIQRQVQAVVDDLGRRQQHQFDQQIAERFLRLARDVDTQRSADQRRFLQGLNQIDVRTTQLSQVQNLMLRQANVQEIR